MYQGTFRMFAAYNRWANDRLYGAVRGLTKAEFTSDRGLFFHSICGTLNHLLVTDRIWMRRFTGEGADHRRLDDVLTEDFVDLEEERRSEDKRIKNWIDALSENDFSSTFTYSPVTNPREITQKLAPALFQLFNHHAHHRGQCHAGLTGLGKNGPALDLIQYQRESGIDRQ